MNRSKTTLFLVQGAIIAAMYVVLTLAASALGMSSGAIQFRISEALCVLPAFTPAAIPGLFIGCLVANFFSGCQVLDILFGSLATLIGAAGAYAARRWRPLIPFATVLANVLIVPPVLRYAYGATEAIPYLMLTVGAGELVCCFALGIPLTYLLDRHALQLGLQPRRKAGRNSGGAPTHSGQEGNDK